jgi:hypothetical protein
MKTRFTNHRLPIRLGLLILLILWLAAGALAVLAAGSLTIPVSRTTGGGQIMTGGGYTVVGAAGQPDAGRLYGGSLRVNGGVIGEMVTQPQPPIISPRAYLPITWSCYPQWAVLNETEPNNLFNQANPIPNLPVLVKGSHDGAAGGGDVFSLTLEAGRGVDVSLFTENVSGVQLLAYDAAGTELTRDYAAPFMLAFTTSYSGTYYVYVFSASEAGNNASYTLTLRVGSPLPGFEPIAAPAVDEGRLNQPPEIKSGTP